MLPFAPVGTQGPCGWPAGAVLHADTTSFLCGLDYAGAASVFYNTCSGVCYQDWVLGDPSHYDTAYFEVSYLRVYGQPGELTVLQPSSTRRSAELSYLPGVGAIALATGSLLAIIWAL